ncbi:MAG: ROK family protein [Verrucomicrobiales bacterium]|nr:ROK family protein [Verrucomicrobiales bacterium]
MTNQTRPPRYLVGVDLGGAKMLAGIYDETIRRVDTVKRSTKSDRGPAAVIERIARCIRDVIDEADARVHDVRAVVVGVPGKVDRKAGWVVQSDVLGWADVPLVDRLQEAIGLPVLIENDHQLATLGVYTLELKSRPRRLLGLFIGARIGGGWLVDGNLCEGFAEVTEAIGHLMLDPKGPRCRCGGHGCFESLASRHAVLDQIHRAMLLGRRTVLEEALDGLGRLRAKDLFRAYRGGDALTCEVIDSAARWIRVALANLVETLKPEVVVLGGGMTEVIREALRDSIFRSGVEGHETPTIDDVPVWISSLGDEACLAGAALLARQHGEVNNE